jgi:hypothetical protein
VWCIPTKSKWPKDLPLLLLLLLLLPPTMIPAAAAGGAGEVRALPANESAWQVKMEMHSK